MNKLFFYLTEWYMDAFVKESIQWIQVLIVWLFACCWFLNSMSISVVSSRSECFRLLDLLAGAKQQKPVGLLDVIRLMANGGVLW